LDQNYIFEYINHRKMFDKQTFFNIQFVQSKIQLNSNYPKWYYHTVHLFVQTSLDQLLSLMIFLIFYTKRVTKNGGQL
jgi:hypothetical protein